ncbi:MAG: hypothetical protein AAFV07_20880, partial [Bacteroidota bacterium]
MHADATEPEVKMYVDYFRIYKPAGDPTDYNRDFKSTDDWEQHVPVRVSGLNQDDLPYVPPYATPADKIDLQPVSTSYGTMAVSPFKQVFYRGPDNEMYREFQKEGQWMYEKINYPYSNSHRIGGDMVASYGEQIFYRGADGRLQVFNRPGTPLSMPMNFNQYSRGYIDNNWGTNAYFVHSAPGSIGIYNGNSTHSGIFYRGQDNRLHRFYWTFSTGWTHEYISPAIVGSGNIVVADLNTVFFRGIDGRVHRYVKSGSSWVHAILGSPSDMTVSPTAGSITYGNYSVYYRGVDNRLYRYYYQSIHQLLNSSQTISSKILFKNNRIFFRTGGRLRYFYQSGANWPVEAPTNAGPNVSSDFNLKCIGDNFVTGPDSDEVF